MSATSGESELTLQSVGEFEIITRIREITNAQAQDLPKPIVDSGDDSAVIAMSKEDLVVSVDLFVEGRHFKTDWATALEIGRRCAAAAMSDICAMGTAPTSILVGLAAPADTSVAFIRELTTGLAHEAAGAGARVVGGDLSSADSIVVSVTAIGSMKPKDVVTRSGAQVGDVVAIHGRLGMAAAGLRVLQRGLRSPRVLVDAYRYPEIDYSAGVRARTAGAKAMADVSDGLVADLGHIAAASGVTIDIESASLPVPEALTSAASAFGADPLAWILTGGDDHALAAVFPSNTELPQGFVAIGIVREQADDLVLVDSEPAPSEGGFSHFG